MLQYGSNSVSDYFERSHLKKHTLFAGAGAFAVLVAFDHFGQSSGFPQYFPHMIYLVLQAALSVYLVSFGGKVAYPFFIMTVTAFTAALVCAALGPTAGGDVFRMVSGILYALLLIATSVRIETASRRQQSALRAGPPDPQ